MKFKLEYRKEFSIHSNSIDSAVQSVNAVFAKIGLSHSVKTVEERSLGLLVNITESSRDEKHINVSILGTHKKRYILDLQVHDYSEQNTLVFHVTYWPPEGDEGYEKPPEHESYGLLTWRDKNFAELKYEEVDEREALAALDEFDDEADAKSRKKDRKRETRN
jgi:hypothetical protein